METWDIIEHSAYLKTISLHSIFSDSGVSGWKMLSDRTNSPNSITPLRFRSNKSNILSEKRLCIFLFWKRASWNSSWCFRSKSGSLLMSRCLCAMCCADAAHISNRNHSKKYQESRNILCYDVSWYMHQVIFPGVFCHLAKFFTTSSNFRFFFREREIGFQRTFHRLCCASSPPHIHKNSIFGNASASN